jgi:uncharacterized membrane protein YvlD (DUF360 family)
MKIKVKEVLKDQIRLVRQSKLKIITGTLLTLLDIGLVVASYITIYSLIFTLPLLYVIRKQIFEYRINSAVLMLTRYLIDDEYSKKFDKENNINQNKDEK